MLRATCLSVGLQEDLTLAVREGFGSAAYQARDESGKCWPQVPYKYVSSENWLSVRMCITAAIAKGGRCE